jgi:hypothetical protein
MRVITWPWRIILLTLLALLAIPATRATLRDQIDIFSPFSPREFYLYYQTGSLDDEDPANNMEAKRGKVAERGAAKYPQDWQIALGAGLLVPDSDKKMAWLKKAERLAPEAYKPVALSALVKSRIRDTRYGRKEELGYDRPIPEGWQERTLAPEKSREIRRNMEQWQKLDPDNAAPKALLAWLDFGEKQDADGLAQLKAAARGPRLDFYYPDLAEAQIQALRAGGLTEYNAVLYGISALTMSQLGAVRQAARIARYKGEEAWAGGRHQTATETWLEVIRLGRQLRYQGEIFIENLVGSAVEAIGAAPIYIWSTRERAAERGLKPAYPLTGKVGRYNEGDIYQGKNYDDFRREAGLALTADIFAGLVQSQELKRLGQATIYQNNETLDRSLLLNLPGPTMLLAMALLVLLSGITGLLTLKWKSPLPGLQPSWVVLFSLFALFPIWGDLLYVIALSAGRENFLGLGGIIGYYYDTGHIGPPGLHVTPLIILAPLISYAAAWIYFKAKPASFGSVFLGLMRQTLPVCLMLLVLSYAGLAVYTALLRGEVVRLISQEVREGEMAPLRRAHPELFQPPEALPAGDKGDSGDPRSQKRKDE